jgi:hypothetical protein
MQGAVATAMQSDYPRLALRTRARRHQVSACHTPGCRHQAVRAERRRPAASQACSSPRRLKPVRVGCSGWNYRDWRGRLYPEGVPPARWLELYSRVFDTVEVNSTFYRLASQTAVRRWVEQTPEKFTFTVT